MKYAANLVFDYLLATVAAYVLASLLHTQFVLHELIKLGVEIDLTTRISTSAQDLLGLLPAYGTTIALALLLAFLVTALINKLTKSRKAWLYPLAGGCGIFAALLAMHPILDITLIAGARSSLGLFAQCFAGIFGGWAFMYQRNKRNTTNQ